VGPLSRAPGQGMVEYALMAVGGAIIMVLTIYALGPPLARLFGATAASLP
jgi:Flp pilus assembly pilin Flp